MTTMIKSKVSLYCTEGNADKVYTIWIEDRGKGLFTVEVQWGRRGGSVQSGSKTQQPTILSVAESIYDKTIAEKKAKGYHEGEDAPAFSQVEGAVDSGLRPMLLTDSTDEGEAKYVESDEWAAQEKVNGRRLLIRISKE